MGNYKNKAYPLRLNNELMEKIRTIAQLEDRKLSNQFEKIVKDYIKQYEAEHGEITIDED